MQVACPNCGQLLLCPDPAPPRATCSACGTVFSIAAPTFNPGAQASGPAPFRAARPTEAAGVTAPAVCLLIAGALWASWATFNWIGLFLTPDPPVVVQENEIAQGMRIGRKIGRHIGPVLMGMGVLIIAGSIQMLRRRGYGLAMTASVVAMLPCSPSCILGLPFGIWSLVVLNRPEVRDAFR